VVAVIHRARKVGSEDEFKIDLNRLGGQKRGSNYESGYQRAHGRIGSEQLACVHAAHAHLTPEIERRAIRSRCRRRFAARV
jgi:hypothetical protein